MTDAEPLLSRVAVVMVSYNTADALRGSLRAVTAGDGAALEVVVVDNASSDGSAAMVREEFPQVRLIEEGVNHGFGAAANIGAAATEREFVLLLNPDCSLPPVGVEELARRLHEDPELGFAGPRIDLGPGRVDHASLRADPDPVGAAIYFSRVTRLFPNSARVNRYSLRHLDYDKEQELQAGTAACLMVRHSLFNAVGGFDEAFFMYGEDLDLCRRLRQAGGAGRYVPSARAIHVKGVASRQRSQRMLVEFHKAMWIYYRKHEAPQHAAPLNGLVAAGITGLAAARLALNAARREKRVSRR